MNNAITSGRNRSSVAVRTSLVVDLQDKENTCLSYLITQARPEMPAAGSFRNHRYTRHITLERVARTSTLDLIPSFPDLVYFTVPRYSPLWRDTNDKGCPQPPSVPLFKNAESRFENCRLFLTLQIDVLVALTGKGE